VGESAVSAVESVVVLERLALTPTLSPRRGRPVGGAAQARSAVKKISAKSIRMQNGKTEKTTNGH